MIVQILTDVTLRLFTFSKIHEKTHFFMHFFEKILLFQGVILKSNDFFVHIFYNIRL